MKTSVIRYRVADFLREFSPFDVISLDDLLAFAGGGRVVFHEDDIYLFRKGQAREAVFWVVQQGRVELLNEHPAGEQLRDVLGPGDILGLRRHAADQAYQNTARTATEVILYSFDLGAFEALAGKYPAAGRFLAAHLSAATQHTKALQAPVTKERLLTEREKAVWLNAAALPAEWPARRLVTCGAQCTVGEAARRMAEARGEAVAVVGADGQPLGLVTGADLRDRLAAGAASADAPVEAVMNRRFLTVRDGRRPADYVLEMLRGRGQFLVATGSGSAASPLRGIITDADLEVACGRNPVVLLREMLAAETAAEMAYLWRRTEAFLAESLAGPSAVEWLSQMLGEFYSALVERVVRLAEAELARVGRQAPDVARCWLLFGAAGRRELLTPAVPELGLVYADPPADERETAEGYFSTLARKVAAKLEACGLRAPRRGPGEEERRRCQALSQWKEFYRGLIRDPIGGRIYTAREHFDFRVAVGEPALGEELLRLIAEELEVSETCIPVLANDTIASLPPLTFYQGFVIETDGRRSQTLDAEKTALAPIADAARVLAFAARDVGAANTLGRLRRLAGALPPQASTLADAAEAWRIVSYHHAQAALSGGGEGAGIQPARLSRFEQRLLKAAFDSTRRFVELASSTPDLEVLR
jgi:CBS domain-containing protein